MSDIGKRPSTARGWLVLPVLVALVAMAACNKEKFDEMVEKGKQKIDQGVSQAKDSLQDAQKSVQDAASGAKQAVNQTAGQAQEALALAGSMELNLDSPAKTSGCYAKFVPGTTSRPAVLRLQSYRDEKNETFPSAYVRAAVKAAAPSELQGQTVAATLYVQAVKDGPVWFSPDGSPVQLKIVTVDDKQIVAEIIGGSLTRTDSGAAAPVTAKLHGYWQSASGTP